MKRKLAGKSPISHDDSHDGNPSVLSQVMVQRTDTCYNEPQVTKRRRSGRFFVGGFSKNAPLINQFEEIVKSAKLAGKEPSSPALSSLSLIKGMTPPHARCPHAPRELRVNVEYLTPQRIQTGIPSFNSSFDVAPSPVTPPLSQRLRAICMKDEEQALVPSPQGMTLSQSSCPSPHNVNQTIKMIETPGSNHDSDSLFLDAEDVALGENSGELDLNEIDVFIDKLLEKNPEDQNQQGEISSLPELENLNLSFDNAKSLAKANVTCSEGTIRLESEFDSTVLAAVVKPAAISSNLPTPLDLNSNTISEPVLSSDGTNEKSPLGAPTEITVSASQCNTARTDAVSNELYPHRSVKRQSPTNICTLQTKTNNHEAFGEDLNLSTSQLLDIDAKCNLLQDKHQKIDPQLKGGPSNVDTDFKQQERRKELHDLGFSIPAAPSLSWIQKVVDSGQRLRAVTQEVSRLNAMVLRARRTLWPQQPVMSQHQLHQNYTSNQTMMSQPISSQSPENSGFPFIFPNQDWNIS